MTFDLRGYLEKLKENYPDEIATVDSPVSIEFDMTAYAIELERKQRYPILFFKNVDGFDYPVVANIFASRHRIALALDLEERDLITRWNQCASIGIPPKVCTEAPVKEVILTGKDIDLYNYPIPVHFEEDAGRYITGGVSIANDPDTGVGNLNFTRLQLQGPALLGASLHSRGDLWDFQRRQEARGKPLEIAVAIGVHPCISIAGATRLPISEDEMELAGGLYGEAVPVIRAETVDLMVPAFAEMIIEGYIEPGARGNEGPFGEYTGYASDRSTRNVFHVTAVTHRSDMIYQDIVPGASAEHLNLSKASRVPRVYESVKQTFPNVVDINYPMSGTHFHCYISLHKTMEGQPKQVMMLLFGLDMYLKHIIVVDDDVDVYNEQQVLWALATRFQADRDLFVVSDVVCNLLDPSAINGVGAKMGIDATLPLDSTAKSLEYSEDILLRVKQGLNRLLEK